MKITDKKKPIKTVPKNGKKRRTQRAKKRRKQKNRISYELRIFSRKMILDIWNCVSYIKGTRGSQLHRVASNN